MSARTSSACCAREQVPEYRHEPLLGSRRGLGEVEADACQGVDQPLIGGPLADHGG
jgi:hypothetical protein